MQNSPISLKLYKSKNCKVEPSDQTDSNSTLGKTSVFQSPNLAKILPSQMKQVLFESDETITDDATKVGDPLPILPSYDLLVPKITASMYTNLMFHMFFPITIICLLFLVPLTEPTKYWDANQVSNLMVFVEALFVVFLLFPIAFLNVQHKMQVIVCSWWMILPLLGSFIAQLLFTIFLPYWIGKYPIPFLFWGIGPLIWAIGVFFCSYAFVKELQRNGVEPSVKRSDVITAFKCFAIPLAAAVGVYLFLGCLVIIKFSNTWYTLLLVGTFILAVRAALTHICYESLKAPYGRHSEGWLEIFLSSVSFTWFKFALPEIDNIGLFALTAFTDCFVLLIYGLWMIPVFEVWMLSEPIPREPFQPGAIIVKVWETYVWRKPILRFQKKVTKNWKVLARTRIFSLLWSHLSSTVTFMCFYSMVIFSPNGKYMAFYTTDFYIWQDSMIASAVFFILQILTVLALMAASHFGKQGRGMPDGKEEEDMHLFEHGILLFQI
ncbi:hypothetical protein HDU99_005897, partial [Rhizoclosmatium hyalinum]